MVMKQRNLDGIFVRHEGKNVCLTDLPWEVAYGHIEDLLLRSVRPMDSYFGILETFHKRLREVGDAYDISEHA